MTHTLNNARSAKLRRLAALLVTGLGLAGCDETDGDPEMQIGANTVLPALQPYLIPPMREQVHALNHLTSVKDGGFYGCCYGQQQKKCHAAYARRTPERI